MAEHIYVNLTNSPVSVGLPSGSTCKVMPGQGIKGGHFARYAQAGLLVPIEGCGKNLRPSVVHEPTELQAPPPPPPAPPKKEDPPSSPEKEEPKPTSPPEFKKRAKRGFKRKS